MRAIGVVSIACYGAGVLGGLALFVAPFTHGGRRSPRWTRIALWICGPVSAAWGALGLVLMLAWQGLSRESYDLVVHFRAFFAGIGVGLLVLLFASGEFVPAFSHRRGAKSP